MHADKKKFDQGLTHKEILYYLCRRLQALNLLTLTTMRKDNPTNDPNEKPNWLLLVAKIVVYAIGLIAAAYGVQTAAALLR